MRRARGKRAEAEEELDLEVIGEPGGLLVRARRAGPSVNDAELPPRAATWPALPASQAARAADGARDEELAPGAQGGPALTYGECVS